MFSPLTTTTGRRQQTSNGQSEIRDLRNNRNGMCLSSRPSDTVEGVNQQGNRSRLFPAKQTKSDVSSSALYIDDQDLEPFASAPSSSILPQLLRKLKKSDKWHEQFHTLTELRRLLKHHAYIFSTTNNTGTGESYKGRNAGGLVASVIRETLVLSDSLRSNVAKNAIIAIHDIFLRIPNVVAGKTIVEDAMSYFVKRSSGIVGGSAFLLDEADRTLIQICRASHDIKFIGFILRQLEIGNNPKLQARWFWCLTEIFNLLGVQSESTLSLYLKDFKSLAVVLYSALRNPSEICRKEARNAAGAMMTFLCPIMTMFVNGHCSLSDLELEKLLMCQEVHSETQSSNSRSPNRRTDKVLGGAGDGRLWDSEDDQNKRSPYAPDPPICDMINTESNRLSRRLKVAESTHKPICPNGIPNLRGICRPSGSLESLRSDYNKCVSTGDPISIITSRSMFGDGRRVSLIEEQLESQRSSSPLSYQKSKSGDISRHPGIFHLSDIPLLKQLENPVLNHSKPKLSSDSDCSSDSSNALFGKVQPCVVTGSIRNHHARNTNSKAGNAKHENSRIIIQQQHYPHHQQHHSPSVITSSLSNRAPLGKASEVLTDQSKYEPNKISQHRRSNQPSRIKLDEFTGNHMPSNYKKNKNESNIESNHKIPKLNLSLPEYSKHEVRASSLDSRRSSPNLNSNSRAQIKGVNSNEIFTKVQIGLENKDSSRRCSSLHFRHPSHDTPIRSSSPSPNIERTISFDSSTLNNYDIERKASSFNGLTLRLRPNIRSSDPSELTLLCGRNKESMNFSVSSNERSEPVESKTNRMKSTDMVTPCKALLNYSVRENGPNGSEQFHELPTMISRTEDEDLRSPSFKSLNSRTLYDDPKNDRNDVKLDEIQQKELPVFRTSHSTEERVDVTLDGYEKRNISPSSEKRKRRTGKSTIAQSTDEKEISRRTTVDLWNYDDITTSCEIGSNIIQNGEIVVELNQKGDENERKVIRPWDGCRTGDSLDQSVDEKQKGSDEPSEFYGETGIIDDPGTSSKPRRRRKSKKVKAISTLPCFEISPSCDLFDEVKPGAGTGHSSLIEGDAEKAGISTWQDMGNPSMTPKATSRDVKLDTPTIRKRKKTRNVDGLEGETDKTPREYEISAENNKMSKNEGSIRPLRRSSLKKGDTMKRGTSLDDPISLKLDDPIIQLDKVNQINVGERIAPKSSNSGSKRNIELGVEKELSEPTEIVYSDVQTAPTHSANVANSNLPYLFSPINTSELADEENKNWSQIVTERTPNSSEFHELSNSSIRLCPPARYDESPILKADEISSAKVDLRADEERDAKKETKQDLLITFWESEDNKSADDSPTRTPRPKRRPRRLNFREVGEDILGSYSMSLSAEKTLMASCASSHIRIDEKISPTIIHTETHRMDGFDKSNTPSVQQMGCLIERQSQVGNELTMEISEAPYYATMRRTVSLPSLKDGSTNRTHRTLTKYMRDTVKCQSSHIGLSYELISGSRKLRMISSRRTFIEQHPSNRRPLDRFSYFNERRRLESMTASESPMEQSSNRTQEFQSAIRRGTLSIHQKTVDPIEGIVHHHDRGSISPDDVNSILSGHQSTLEFIASDFLNFVSLLTSLILQMDTDYSCLIFDDQLLKHCLPFPSSQIESYHLSETLPTEVVENVQLLLSQANELEYRMKLSESLVCGVVKWNSRERVTRKMETETRMTNPDPESDAANDGSTTDLFLRETHLRLFEYRTQSEHVRRILYGMGLDECIAGVDYIISALLGQLEVLLKAVESILTDLVSSTMDL